jgi:hypothetical protein
LGAGFTYLTDELSLLTSELGRIRAAPVSLGLKSGSWPILATRFSLLKRLPTHRQADGTAVRYLPPPNEPTLNRRTYGVTYMVFPRYKAGEPTELSSIEPAEALYRLAEAGYAVPGSLDAELVEYLITWIGQLNCYQLRIGDTASAVVKVQELLM